MSNLASCPKCHWVYFTVTRAEAESSVKQFNEYYDTLTPELQKAFYGNQNSSIKDYEECGCGASYKDFTDNTIELYGVTLNPIIARGE